MSASSAPTRSLMQRSLAETDPDIANVLTPIELDALFDLAYHTKHVDTIFARVFGKA